MAKEKWTWALISLGRSSPGIARPVVSVVVVVGGGGGQEPNRNELNKNKW